MFIFLFSVLWTTPKRYDAKNAHASNEVSPVSHETYDAPLCPFSTSEIPACATQQVIQNFSGKKKDNKFNLSII